MTNDAEKQVYPDSGGTQKIGPCTGGVDSRFGDQPAPRPFHVEAGICVKCNITVMATNTTIARRQVQNRLKVGESFKIDGFNTQLQEIEFIDIVE